MAQPVDIDPLVFAAVLAAAAMHAGWNALLKLRLEPFLAMALITTGAGVVGLPFLLIFGWPCAAAWPWLMGSVALHLAYYCGLTEAYRRADMGQVYPIARGTAPLLTIFASLAFLGEPIGIVAASGAAILAIGVVLISLRGGRYHLAPLDPGALVFALLTSFAISGYTLVDGIGARMAGDAHAYSASLFVIDGISMGLFAFWRRGRAAFAATRQFAAPAFAGGAMSLFAYWIAIWAMTVAPIGLVGALRETSVLFAVLISTFVLKEPLTQGRMIGAALIVVGVILMRVQ
jgi:drug/metabolite transporter (DMT)-like permease